MRALAFSTALIVLAAGPSLAAGTKTFFKPQHGNLPVDFCLFGAGPADSPPLTGSAACAGSRAR
jgi:hypothetical protein